jgi:hypothetical protein
MIINKTNTGNIFFDYILNCIVLSALTLALTKIKYFQNNIYSYLKYIFFNNKRVEINITANNLQNGKSHRLDYSLHFRAICYYIKLIKPIDVYVKREPDRAEKTKNPDYDIFIPDQDIPFILDPTRNIRCLMKLDESESPIKDGNETYIKKHHALTIFSENPDIKINDLENFLQDSLKIYRKYIEDVFNKNQYYWCFLQMEQDNDITYSEKIFNTNRTFNTIFFEEKPAYLKSIDFFLKNESWYKVKGIPYHFGIFLHGSPGCGKTSIIKATIQYTGRHVISIPLNRIKTCGQLEAVFYEDEINGKTIPMDKRIYIFEDIDCLCSIVKSRESKDDNSDTSDKFNTMEYKVLMKMVSDKSNDKIYDPDDDLTLSCFLNIIDGVLETPGRIMIMTSNYPGIIDKAILRPGRIDINLELKKSSLQILIEILVFFYDIELNTVLGLVSNISYKDYDMSPAEIMNICEQYYDDINKCINEIDKYIYRIRNN